MYYILLVVEWRQEVWGRLQLYLLGTLRGTQRGDCTGHGRDIWGLFLTPISRANFNNNKERVNYNKCLVGGQKMFPRIARCKKMSLHNNNWISLGTGPTEIQNTLFIVGSHLDDKYQNYKLTDKNIKKF